MGGNELGHVRVPIETDRCFCGQTGCLERIVSTDFLRRTARTRKPRSLRERVDAGNAAMATMLRHLCNGLANAVSFLRPGRLVLVGPMAGAAAFRDALAAGTATLEAATLLTTSAPVARSKAAATPH